MRWCIRGKKKEGWKQLSETPKMKSREWPREIVWARNGLKDCGGDPGRRVMNLDLVTPVSLVHS